MDTHRHFLEQKLKLPEEQWQLFFKYLVREEYARKAVILRKGEIEKKLSLILLIATWERNEFDDKELHMLAKSE
ncbi:hypothetical protein [Desertivirga arenae]|uniref:hypothetical protein n=1 Tax=Desertivirga arenae TaxID=2810309 RepID=UPI001A973B0F|nr:hypothetical protein [Pedobacter sp. SYSU D00823]